MPSLQIEKHCHHSTIGKQLLHCIDPREGVCRLLLLHHILQDLCRGSIHQLQVLTAGSDGKLCLCPHTLTHQQAGPAAYADAGPWESFSAACWLTGDTFVTAGTSGESRPAAFAFVSLTIYICHHRCCHPLVVYPTDAALGPLPDVSLGC